MKIALINTSVLAGRGSDLVVHHLAHELSERHEVTVYAPFGANLPNGRYRILTPPSGLSRAAAWLTSFRQLWALRRESAKFDVINCHHALLSLLLPTDKLVTTYHGYRGRRHFLFGRRFAEWVSNRVRHLLIARALRRSRKVTLVSRSLEPEVARAGLTEEPSVIYNGVDMEGLAHTQPEQPLEPGRYLLYLGRVDPDKSVDRLLTNYVASGIDVPLVIAGDGIERARLERAYSKYSLVRFVGAKTRAEIPELLRQAIGFVTASSYETFCLPVIEAAAMGRPSVGPSSGSLPEVIRHGETGYLYGSDEEFRDAITRLARATPARVADWGRNCQTWASQFGWQERQREYERIFEAVCSGAGQPGRPPVARLSEPGPR